MKKKGIIALLLAMVMCLCLASCGDTEKYEELTAEIDSKISSADLEEAYNLCQEALSLNLKDDQAATIESQKATILEVAFPGTFIAKPEYVADITPMEIGESCYFDLDSLTGDTYDVVNCRYSFSKDTEMRLAAEQYQKYLEGKFTFVDVKVKSGDKTGYTYYVYADENGNSIALQVIDHISGGNYSFLVELDKDLYDLDRIDTTVSPRTSLLDSSILLDK